MSRQKLSGADNASLTGAAGESGVSPQTTEPTASPVPETDRGEPGGKSEKRAPKSVEPRYEPPSWAVYEEWITFGDDAAPQPPGLYRHYIRKLPRSEGGEGVQTDDYVCTPILVRASTSDDAGESHGLDLRIADRRSLRGGRLRWVRWVMRRSLLARVPDVNQTLLDLGADPRNPAAVVDWLKRQPTEKGTPRLTAAAAIGWTKDASAYVLPERSIGSDSVIYQPEQAPPFRQSAKGTLDQWRAEVGARCEGNPILLLAVSAAFAGPMLKLTGTEKGGAGLHLFGASSKGKSSAMHAAASVWGDPSDLVRTWRATANGIEGACAASNDAALFLDEMGQGSSDDSGALVYLLANGAGKMRAQKSGVLKSPQTWRLFALSTGEVSLSEHAEGTMAGQEVRLLSLPATDRAHGAFDDLHDCTDPQRFVDGLRSACTTSHGRAGPALVEALAGPSKADKRSALRECLYKVRARFEAAPGIEGRAADTFALLALAGETATKLGISGWPEGEALRAALEAFDDWKAQGAARTEPQRICDGVLDFIGRHRARFQEDGNSLVPQNRAGWIDGNTYLFTRQALKEASGYEAPRAAKALKAAGWLHTNEADRCNVKPPAHIKDAPSRVYSVIPPPA